MPAPLTVLLVDKITSEEALRLQGNAKLTAGDIDGAIAIYQTCLELDPCSHQTMTNLSYAKYLQHDLVAALQYADAAIAAQPSWIKGHFRRALALLALRNGELALESLDTCLQLDASFDAARKHIGKARFIAAHAQQGTCMYIATIC
jgi:tetratricopeptide (TPR) repeat protein